MKRRRSSRRMEQDDVKGALVVCTGVYLAPLGDSNTVMPRGGGLC